MANKRLFTIVTILLLVGSSSGAQPEPSIEDLLTIEKLLTDRQWSALYDFLESKPHLTNGETALATELRSFMDDAKRRELIDFDAPTDIAVAEGGDFQTTRNASIY